MKETKYEFLSRLAEFLRVNGENLINGTCKLSLTAYSLSLINSIFVDLAAHERGETSHLPEECSTKEFRKDAQFLLDFINKTKMLKLFHGVQTLRGDIDISHFKGLTTLELKKIPAHLIVGLDELSHLKSLTCNRSLSSLEELLRIYTEQRSEDSWFRIEVLNVSSNHLEGLGLDCLRAVRYVKTLDASRNNLKYLYELVAPEKLEVLKLCYNVLHNIPLLHPSSSFSLKVLLMRNNNVEHLNGLELLINLEEFDISCNCISEYKALKPLQALKSLNRLNLMNNPLTQSKHYCEHLVTYFHMDVVARGLTVDGKKLTPEDIQVHTSRKTATDYECRQQTSIIAIMEDEPSVGASSYQPYRPFKDTVTHARSVMKCSQGAETDERSLSSSRGISTDVAGIQSKGNGSKKSRKKMREAVILQPAKPSGDDASSSAEVSGHNMEFEVPSHIITKRLIETRRKEFGEEWLIPSVSFQNLVIGETAEHASHLTSNVSDVSYSKYQVNLPSESCVEESQTKESQSSYSKGDSVEPRVGDIDTIPSEAHSSLVKLSERKQSVISDDIQVLESSSYDQELNNIVIEAAKCMAAFPMYVKQGKKEEMHYSDKEDIEDDVVISDSEEESEDRIFILERKEESKCYPLFVCIGKKFLKEKVFKTGRLFDVLDLSNLLSVRVNNVLIDGKEKCEIVLTFETLQARKQKRTYICEVQHGMNMAAILQPFADAKAFEDATVGALQCLRCRSVFSRQVAQLKVKKKFPLSHDLPKGDIEETDACPNCGSSLVLELDSMPLPSAMLPATVRKPEDSSKKSAQSATSSVGQLSSMLYSLIKYTKEKRKCDKPFTSTPKSLGSTEVGKSHYETAVQGTKYETALSFILGHDTDVAEGSSTSESKDLSRKLSRNSSHATIQSQSSIDVISSDSEPDELDVLIEKASVSPPVAIPPSHKDIKAILSTDEDIIPPSVPESPSGYISGDIFHEDEEKVHSGRNVCRPEGQSARIFTMLSERTTWNFSSIDHRLKLYLEFTVFGKEEELDLCLEMEIIHPSSNSEYKGFLVFSSRKIYIIKKVLQEIGYDVAQSVQKLYSFHLSQLRGIRLLPGRQGFAALFGSDKMFFFIIQDSTCCNSFISCIKDKLVQRQRLCGGTLPHFEDCESEDLNQIQNKVFKYFQNISTSMKSDLEVSLYLLPFWSDRSEGEAERVALILTPNYLFVSRISFSRHFSRRPSRDYPLLDYDPLLYKRLTDLIGIQIRDNFKQAVINFLDDESEEFIWRISTSSKSSLYSLVNAIKAPWEELFGVTLPLHLVKDEKAITA